jgi:hypothetical protein
MNQDNTANDLITDDNVKPEMSSGLKVLTILTFIGCAFQFLSSVWNYINAEKSFQGLDKLKEQMNSDSMPGWAKSMLGDPDKLVQMITKSYENRIPILIMALVATALCFYGALQMRKLKKQGFMFYTIGELLPFLSQFLFIGAFSLSGMFFFIFVGITFLFILLYALQRKYLVY